MIRLSRHILTALVLNVAAMVAVHPHEAHRPPAPPPTSLDIALALEPRI